MKSLNDIREQVDRIKQSGNRDMINKAREIAKRYAWNILTSYEWNVKYHAYLRVFTESEAKHDERLLHRTPNGLAMYYASLIKHPASIYTR